MAYLLMDGKSEIDCLGESSSSSMSEPPAKQPRTSAMAPSFTTNGLKVIVPKRLPQQQPPPSVPVRPSLVDMETPSSSTTGSRYGDAGVNSNGTVQPTRQIPPGIDPDRYLIKSRIPSILLSAKKPDAKTTKQVTLPGRQSVKKGPLPDIKPTVRFSLPPSTVDPAPAPKKNAGPPKETREISTSTTTDKEPVNTAKKRPPPPAQPINVPANSTVFIIPQRRITNGVSNIPIKPIESIKTEIFEQPSTSAMSQRNLTSEFSNFESPTKTIANQTDAPLTVDVSQQADACYTNDNTQQTTPPMSPITSSECNFYVGRARKDDVEFLFVNDLNFFTSDFGDYDGADAKYDVCNIVCVLPTFEMAHKKCLALCQRETLPFGIHQHDTLSFFWPDPPVNDKSTFVNARTSETIANNLKKVTEAQQAVNELLKSVQSSLYDRIPATNPLPEPDWIVPKDEVQNFKLMSTDKISFLRLYYRRILTEYEACLPPHFVPAHKIQEVKRGLYRFFHAPDKEDQANHEAALKQALTSVRLHARRNLRKNFVEGTKNLVAIGKTTDMTYHYTILNDRWIPFINCHLDAVVPNVYNVRLDFGIPIEEPESLFVISTTSGKLYYKVLDVPSREFIYSETEKGKSC